MWKQPHWLKRGLAAGLILLWLSLPARFSDAVKTAVAHAYLPLMGVGASVRSLSDRAGLALVPRRRLLREIERLREENRQLRLQLTQAEAWRRENVELRRLVGWRQTNPWKSQAARVVSRDPSDWWRTIWIDRGAKDGLKANLPVLTPEGLAGRTWWVGLGTSQVLLLGDPKCHVAVEVRDTGEQGVLTRSASGSMDPRLVTMGYLPPSASLRSGQIVVTSGLGGVFPAGIPVGRIVDWRSVSYGLYTEARVKLFVDSSRLKHVLVLLP